MADDGKIHLNELQIQKLAEAIGRNLTKYASALHPGWFSTKSAAAYSDFSLSAIESALRLGQIKHKRVKIKGTARCVRIKREWLDAWIEDQPED